MRCKGGYRSTIYSFFFSSPSRSRVAEVRAFIIARQAVRACEPRKPRLRQCFQVRPAGQTKVQRSAEGGVNIEGRRCRNRGRK